MNTIAIVPARGGSKGIPNKNMTIVCGKPLLHWTIQQCLDSNIIEKVYVSTDSKIISDCATSAGADVIVRPDELASDVATSDSAWLHAINTIKVRDKISPKILVLPQATSPIRSPSDFDDAILEFASLKLDSMLSVCEVEDRFIWEKSGGMCYPINYDYLNRQPRQRIGKTFMENGSFYITKTSTFLKSENRLNGKIGMFIMDDFKQFQIDKMSDIPIAEAIMKEFMIKQNV